MDHRTSRYPRGKVTPVQEFCLQHNKSFLMNELDCREVILRLRSKFILSDDDEQYIMRGKTRRERNRRLVDIVINRTSKGFQAFVQALEDTGHDNAYSSLKQSLGELQKDSQVKGNDSVSKVKDAVLPTDSEASGNGKMDILHEQVDSLAGALNDVTKDMGHVNERVDVLSTRLTIVDGDKKQEIVYLKIELTRARTEVERLRKENEDLTDLVNDRTEELRKAERKVKTLEHRILSLESQLGEVREELVQQKEEWEKQAERHNTEMIQQRQAAHKQSERFHRELKYQKQSAQKLAQQQSEELGRLWQVISQVQDQQKKHSKMNAGRPLHTHNCSREGPSVSTQARLGNIRGAPPAQATPASQTTRRTTLRKNSNRSRLTSRHVPPDRSMKVTFQRSRSETPKRQRSGDSSPSAAAKAEGKTLDPNQAEEDLP